MGACTATCKAGSAALATQQRTLGNAPGTILLSLKGHGASQYLSLADQGR